QNHTRLPRHLWRCCPLSHHGGVFGLDFVEDADFAGLAVGIFVHAEILLGQLVDAVVGAIFRDLDDAATNFHKAVGIFGIVVREGHTGIAADVAVLLASFGGVED